MSAEPFALLTLAVTAARAAAALVRERAEAGVSVAATKSSDVDVVTQADRDSESLIRETIRAQRPEDAFLGEEFGAGEPDRAPSGAEAGSASGSPVRWIVDPIDGTVNFLYGSPEYAVSIAAEVDGRPVAGVVLNVATGVEYTAYRDASGALVGAVDAGVGAASVPGGARLPRLGVRAAVPLGQQLLLTGFSYDAEVRRRQAEVLVRLLPAVRDIRRHGSAALELCRIACGQGDAYAEVGLHHWDYAAGVLVAEAAGARWQVLDGMAGRDLVVCAPAASFDTLRDAVLAAGMGATQAAGPGDLPS